MRANEKSKECNRDMKRYREKRTLYLENLIVVGGKGASGKGDRGTEKVLPSCASLIWICADQIERGLERLCSITPELLYALFSLVCCSTSKS